MNNKLLIVIITLLCIIVIALSVCLGLLIKKDFKFGSLNIDFTKQENKLIYNEEFDTINNLYIETRTGDIDIKHSDNDKVRVKVYSSHKKELNVTNTEERLNIILKEDIPHIQFGFTNYGKIVVYLPIDYNKNIKIKGNTTNINIAEFENANVNIKTDTGSTNLTAINKAYVEADTGDININNKVNDAVIDTDTGDIHIVRVNNYLDIDTDTGYIKINNAILNKNSKITADTGDITINKINEVWMDTKTDTGSVKIKENFRKSDIELIIKTDTGDIKVGY